MAHPVKATATGILSLIFLVVIPFIFVSTVSAFISQNGGDPSKYFRNTNQYILIFGILYAIFASTGAYYEKGSKKRLVLTLLSSIFLVLWGYFFIGSMSIYYEGDTYAYEVMVPGIALLLAAFLSLKIVYRVVEYVVYRDEYMRGDEENYGVYDGSESSYEEKQKEYYEEDEGEMYF